MSEEKPKILWETDAPNYNTGFSSQSLFLLNGLAEKGWECFMMPHNYGGQKIPPKGMKFADGVECNFWILPHGREPYCKDTIPLRLAKIKPDIYGILLDTFMMPWLPTMDLAPAKTTFWFPSDGGAHLPQGCENVLRKVTMPVAMAKFGQKQAKDVHGINTEYIPHGVFSEKFTKLPDEIRTQIKRNWACEGKFVVGTMYRNQPRKFPDRHFKAFAKFAKGKDDVMMFCHTDPTDVAAPNDTFALLNRIGLQNKVVFSGMRFFDGFPYEKMIEIYNLMDVYFSSTSGEGFGIGTVEAMSCEIPIVVPGYTTGDELVRHHKSGEVVKLVGCEDIDFFSLPAQEYDEKMFNGTITGGWNVERGIMDIDHAVEILERMYKDWKENKSEKLKEYGKNGRKAVVENYDWKIVIDKWNHKLRELIDK